MVIFSAIQCHHTKLYSLVTIEHTCLQLAHSSCYMTVLAQLLKQKVVFSDHYRSDWCSVLVVWVAGNEALKCPNVVQTHCKHVS